VISGISGSPVIRSARRGEPVNEGIRLVPDGWIPDFFHDKFNKSKKRFFFAPTSVATPGEHTKKYNFALSVSDATGKTKFAWIYFGGQHGTAHLCFAGQGCRAFESLILRAGPRSQLRISKADFATDVIGIDYVKELRALNDGSAWPAAGRNLPVKKLTRTTFHQFVPGKYAGPLEIRSGLGKGRKVSANEIKPLQSPGRPLGSGTIYHGSFSGANTFTRIYDKRDEQGGTASDPLCSRIECCHIRGRGKSGYVIPWEFIKNPELGLQASVAYALLMGTKTVKVKREADNRDDFSKWCDKEDACRKYAPHMEQIFALLGYDMDRICKYYGFDRGRKLEAREQWVGMAMDQYLWRTKSGDFAKQVSPFVGEKQKKEAAAI
jgi:hypothetical protein